MLIWQDKQPDLKVGLRQVVLCVLWLMVLFDILRTMPLNDFLVGIGRLIKEGGLPLKALAPLPKRCCCRRRSISVVIPV
ncbi:hypothetical protein BBD39_02345 [Arsenophonus endosymbiont of Bemisia tabaci Asia II 3]|nr:hypothetical protein BBD39_02345 [Arsenophonus endosymbiont of Bemisia tabaci Asia II 3]